jgi:hypothetical protein
MGLLNLYTATSSRGHLLLHLFLLVDAMQNSANCLSACGCSAFHPSFGLIASCLCPSADIQTVKVFVTSSGF